MIEIKNLNKSYGKNHVLKDVSLRLEKGKIYGLIGANGSGKSTLMKTMIGLTSYRGSIRYNNISLSGRPIEGKPKIGYMIEEPSFFANMSGRENLILIAKLYENLEKGCVKWALSQVNLLSKADFRYRTYSLGMKQRLHFAFAIMTKPDFLILDEPFNGIDPVAMALFENIIKDFAKRGTTVLISSHMIRELQELVDGAFILDNGKIAFSTEEARKVDLFNTFLDIVKESGSELR